MIRYVEGKYAYYTGHSLKENPYAAGTVEWNEWVDGYMSARTADWERS